MSSDAYGCGSRYILSDTKNRAFLTLKLPFDVVKDTTVSLDLATASAMEMIEYESAIFIRDYFCNDVIEVGEDVVSVSKITEAVQGTVIIEITGFNPEPFFPEYQLSISSEKIILDDGRELLEVRGAKTTLGWLPG